mgnify:FL=1
MNLNIKLHNLTDIINLKFGVYSPLKEFNNEDDFKNIVNNYKTKKNKFFPYPVYFDVNEKIYKKIKVKKKIVLFYKSLKVCEMYIRSFYKIDKKKFGKKIFKTDNKKHPGFNHFLKTGKYFLSGEIKQFNNKILKKIYFSNLKDIKNKIKIKKFKSIAGFHTRNVPHKGHEWIHKYGLKKCKNLFIQPMVGQFRKNEYKDKYIINTNKFLVNKVYKKANIIFGLYNSYPKYGGPREAMLHALVRKNYGCSHFLIGRDHAGVKNYYKKYESQKISKKFEKRLGIKILTFNEPFLCRSCKNIVNKKKHGCKISSIKKINGTFIRSRLLKYQKISEDLMRPEISGLINIKSIIK